MSGTIGGGFINGPPATVFTPEDQTSETRLLADTMTGFLQSEVLPRLSALEAREDGLLRQLLTNAGHLGLLASSVPETYGGLGLSRAASALLYERAALCPSFALAHNVHSGVATLPLVWFGTEEQKRRYLPRLAAGESIGAFALTEANAGSDALSTRCIAIPQDNGFRLIGTKLWITNGGVADLFTVFARIPEIGVTAFLVERNTPGVSLGREEEKLGLRGASTRALYLDSVCVAKENILGVPGKGHQVALIPLNVGRVNIAAGAVGAAKSNLQLAIRYAQERRQFGQPLAQLGLIQSKLGEMAARIFAAESMIYRICGLLDGPEGTPLERSAEYAIECALVKVYATEVAGYVADECLQIHGGYGYSEAFPIARAYRDARVLRIFEGTNEINRLAVVDGIARRIRAGRLSLEAEAICTDDVFQNLRSLLRASLRALAAQVPLDKATREAQEAAALCADIAIPLFAAESVALWATRIRGPLSTFACDIAALLHATADRQGRERVEELAAYLGDPYLSARVDQQQISSRPDTITLRRRLAESVCQSAAQNWLLEMG